MIQTVTFTFGTPNHEFSIATEKPLLTAIVRSRTNHFDEIVDSAKLSRSGGDFSKTLSLELSFYLNLTTR